LARLSLDPFGQAQAIQKAWSFFFGVVDFETAIGSHFYVEQQPSLHLSLRLRQHQFDQERSSSMIILSKAFVIATVLFFSVVEASWAGLVLGFEVSGQVNSGASPLTASAAATGVSTTGLTRGSGMGAGSADGVWGGNGFTSSDLNTAVSASDFATFTVTVDSTVSISFTEVAPYNIRRSVTGPTTGIWQYAIGASSFSNIGSEIAWGASTTTSGNTQAAIDLSGISSLQNVTGATVTFRIVSWSGSGVTGTWYVNNLSGNDLVVNGNITAVPEPTSCLFGICLAIAAISYGYLNRSPANGVRTSSDQTI
jgi:hypothetical protein